MPIVKLGLSVIGTTMPMVDSSWSSRHDYNFELGIFETIMPVVDVMLELRYDFKFGVERDRYASGRRHNGAEALWSRITHFLKMRPNFKELVINPRVVSKCVFKLNSQLILPKWENVRI